MRKCSVAENVAIATKLKYLDILGNIVTKYDVSKDFDRLRREDFEELIHKIDSIEKITVSTKQKYKAVIKKFGRWLAFKDKAFSVKSYPETVDFINTKIKSKDAPKIRASDILSEEEVDRLIEIAVTPMQKAFFSLIYELGSRIGEIGNLKIRDLTKNDYGYLVDLGRKKGTDLFFSPIGSGTALVGILLNRLHGGGQFVPEVGVVMLDGASDAPTVGLDGILGPSRLPVGLGQPA